MWFSAVTALLSTLPLLALTAPAAETSPIIDFDAIIVGGGPAGLSALSALARVRRRVLLVDSGVYRNGPTRHMHDVLGFDGVQPAYYRWAARKQISFYNNAKTMNGTVTKIQPEKDKGFFTVSIKDTKGRELPYLAKKVVLATGLKDLLPATPGVSENWGKGIYWCPWCDGHEHADQALGLLGPLTSVPSTVREILTLNKNIIAFVNGTDTPAQRAKTEEASPQYLDYLKLHNVRIENRTLAAIERLANVSETAGDPSLPTYPEHDSFLVNFTDGGSTRRDAFFVNFKSEQASTLGAELGVETYGGRLGVDNSKGLVTSVPGVYAIGDCNSDNSTNVPHALYSGKRTAVFLHVQLERETANAELAALHSTAKRDLHERARQVWDEVNGKPGDILYAGAYDG